MLHRPNIDGGGQIVGKTQHRLWCSVLPVSVCGDLNYHRPLEYLAVRLIQQLGVFFVLGGLFARGRLGLHDVYLAWSVLEAGSQ